MKGQKTGAPIFVKVDEYKEMLEVLEMIKGKVSEIRQTLGNINSMRDQENAEVATWSNTISDIEKKIDEIDKLMFEPENTW